jgi:hypothetical protein
MRRTVGNASQLANSDVLSTDSDSESILTKSVVSGYESGSTENEAKTKRHDSESSVSESILSDDWEYVEGEFTSRGGNCSTGHRIIRCALFLVPFLLNRQLEVRSSL